VPRNRKAIAVLCIALIVAGGLIPVIASTLGATVFVACWIVMPAIAITVIRRAAFRCEEQPVSLLVLLESRAPPEALARS
jgi:hypothetical protein